jgi:hypothetical protein
MTPEYKFWPRGADRTARHFGGASLKCEGLGTAEPFVQLQARTFASTFSDPEVPRPQTQSGPRAERAQ